jgi:superfamily II DNA/RNA helicase
MKNKALTYLQNAGHSKLLDVQQQAIEASEKAENVIVYSKTGSGKTLAFLLSVLNSIDLEKKGIQALILAPSRELCLQIESVFRSLKTGKKVLACYGGHAIRSEQNSLTESPTILIGTPGRLADHIDRGNLEALSKTAFLVIDEFDKCLEFGFDDDMAYITKKLTGLTNKILVSATRLNEVPDYLDLSKHKVVDRLAEDDKLEISEHLIEYKGEIIETLFPLLCSFKNEKSIVFCNYREVAEDVSNQLREMGIGSVFYHGGLEQDQRERALIKYRNGSSDILVCTDLGARGLDIPEVHHIVHFQYPGSLEAFVHRQGRTARMSADGHSYLFKGAGTEFPMYITPPDSLYQVNEAQDIPKPNWTTLYFSGGKKDKINKIDLVGFLFKKGELSKEEIGLITVQDRAAYVAISRNSIHSLLKRIKNEKVKGKRLKMEISK